MPDREPIYLEMYLWWTRPGFKYFFAQDLQSMPWTSQSHAKFMYKAGHKKTQADT